jgi:hypothetical protein
MTRARRGVRRRDAASGNRKGAIVVMAAVFMVAIMMIAAISVDASRIFAAKNELQTASDAAALAGALQLLEDSSTALDTARIYALRNRVEARAIDSAEIEFGVWSAAEQVFIPGGDPRDAVRVTTRHALPLSLARVFGDSTIAVSASAIAWSSGPVMEPECLKPIAVPYARLLQMLGYPPYNMETRLTDDDIRRLREMSVDDRRWHFHYANEENQELEAPQYGDDHFKRDQYFPIDIDSTWNRNDGSSLFRPSLTPSTYQSYLTGPPTGRCSERVRNGDVVRSEPAPKIQALRDGLSDICESLGGTLSGSSTLTCVQNGQTITMPLRVVFWGSDAPFSQYPVWYQPGQAARLNSQMAGSFVIERMDWNPGGDDDGSRMSHGRVWGYYDVQPAFGVVDETIASGLFRPVLVR